MTNRDWLATLSDEEFYDSFKRVEKTEGAWSIDTRRYMIDWLDAEHADTLKAKLEKEAWHITEK